MFVDGVSLPDHSFRTQVANGYDGAEMVEMVDSRDRSRRGSSWGGEELGGSRGVEEPMLVGMGVGGVVVGA